MAFDFGQKDEEPESCAICGGTGFEADAVPALRTSGPSVGTIVTRKACVACNPNPHGCSICGGLYGLGFNVLWQCEGAIARMTVGHMACPRCNG
ncbi:hypothetical protein [Pseudaestuariivita sp.]|uniref:hypothetical protein n=1 Tax=Pseudaestuariivita sp. TaxID=2211669 RepID=UPI004057EFEF